MDTIAQAENPQTLDLDFNQDFADHPWSQYRESRDNDDGSEQVVTRYFFGTPPLPPGVPVDHSDDIRELLCLDNLRDPKWFDDLNGPYVFGQEPIHELERLAEQIWYTRQGLPIPYRHQDDYIWTDAKIRRLIRDGEEVPDVLYEIYEDWDRDDYYIDWTPPSKMTDQQWAEYARMWSTATDDWTFPPGYQEWILRRDEQVRDREANAAAYREACARIGHRRIFREHGLRLRETDTDCHAIGPNGELIAAVDLTAGIYTDLVSHLSLDIAEFCSTFPKIGTLDIVKNMIIPFSQPQSKPSEPAKWTVTNATTESFKNSKGETQESHTPMGMASIIAKIKSLTGDWPRRVGGLMFVTEGERVDFIAKNPEFFGYLQTKSPFPVEWHNARGFVGQEQVFAEFSRTATRYKAIERIPHEPMIPDHYYVNGDYPAGNGEALQWLLDRFSVATNIDRELIKAALMTVVWGGPGGKRPMFLISSDGRGTGKSTLPTILTELAGGENCFYDIQPEDTIKSIKEQFLEPSTMHFRVARLDNIKSIKFSWAALESLLTTPVISGRPLYIGHGMRPNIVTWIATMNGLSLSKDIATRIVEIKLTRPSAIGSASIETWESETIRYVRENRAAIIGDIIAALREEVTVIAGGTRWQDWDRAVLWRLSDPAEALEAILSRQQIADADEEESVEIESHFHSRLKSIYKLKHDHELEITSIFIPSKIANQWLEEITKRKVSVTASTQFLKQQISEKTIKRLAMSPDTSRRGFVFSAKNSLRTGCIEWDLAERIAKQIAERSQKPEQAD